ncbi:MAG: molybdate ABC transporter substrate-binding protein [Aliarcobacter sp.]|nr:molybdate ABC transporter substrate-binding protein [Aliarcobacter sp.]
MKKIILSLMVLCSSIFADKITVFAAADLRFALDEVKKEFLKESSNHELEMIYGSSGKGMHQIENGAPYDLYFSANEEFVEKLYKEGHAIEPSKLYAVGRIVLWSKNPKFDAKKGFDNLKEPWVKKIAIANPTHAPYGEKAKQAMESLGIFKEIETKLVLGENISHTAQFIETQAADIGVIALSLALAPTISEGTNPDYYLIDYKLHQPLLQGYSITKYAKDNKFAREFYNYISTDRSKEILKKFGFDIPTDMNK